MRRITRCLLAVLAALTLATLVPLAASAHPGPKVTATPSLTIVEPVPGANHAEALIEGTGFLPNRTVTVTLYTPNGPWSATTTTDASGSFSMTFGVYMYPCGTVIPVTAVVSKKDWAAGVFTIQC